MKKKFSIHMFEMQAFNSKILIYLNALIYNIINNRIIKIQF